MPNFTTTTSITTDRGDTLTASKSGSYNEVINVRTEVDNSDSFLQLLAGASSVSANSLRDVKSLIIRNAGSVGAEVLIQGRDWTVSSGTDVMGSAHYDSHLLAAGDYIYIPNQRFLGLSAQLAGANAYTLDNQVPDSNMYVASGALTTEGFADDDDTTITFDDGAGGAAGDMFKANDLIRLDNEICRIVSLTSTIFTVDRGVHGSTKADHTNNTAIRLPFFNAHADFDKFSVSQSDSSGKFKCMNFFGYGRTATGAAAGIVSGSVSGKFYQAGYQEWGLSGITPSTKTGLVASTAYKIDIQVDGGTMFQDLTVTTDSSNGNFGGRSGLIQKIQDALDVQYYTAGNLYEKRVYIAIVNGDVRVTSGQHLSTSAIALTDTGDALSLFDAAAVGRIPAAANLEAPIAARLPDDEIIDRVSGASVPNVGALFYDDGHGNISGACTGTINYETGAISLQGCPPNAQFVVSANYGSAHGGGNKYESDTANSLTKIGARSCNSKINTIIEIIGLR